MPFCEPAEAGTSRLKAAAPIGAHIPVFAIVLPPSRGIHAFWDSPEYVPVKKLREGAAVPDVWAVEGV
jgi:uncharacterized protein (DUF1330 family)